MKCVFFFNFTGVLILLDVVQELIIRSYNVNPI